MKIALVGWGIETQSVYRHFGDEHEYLIVNEEPRGDFPAGPNITVKTLDKKRQPGLTGNAPDMSYLEDIEHCDKVVLSPTAKKVLEKIHSKDSPIWKKVTTSLGIFFEASPTTNIIGVTGTKGKGTTCSLITEFLKACGETVHLGGNIGTPPLDFLPTMTSDDWVVLELSSFQLYTFPHSPHIAVHLMMIPEHIDEWHLIFEDYIDAKANIFRHQSTEDIAIYLPTNEYSTHNVELSPGTHIPYTKSPGAYVEGSVIVIDDQTIIKTSEVGLRGAHNLENICAALTAVWQVHQDAEVMKKAIENFAGLEHRLQLIGEVDGITYIDDSFGTTPDTAIVAMASFEQPKVMIVGGHDKGNEMASLVTRLTKADIKCVIGIGEVGSHIVNELRYAQSSATLHSKDDYNDWTMQEIIALARTEAAPGDVVLLSAGTSSFGIFKDYKDRGNQFIKAVKELTPTK